MKRDSSDSPDSPASGSDSTALYELSERLGLEQGLDVDALEPDHLRAVLDLPFEAQVRLLTRAAAEHWPVARLREQAAELAAPPGAPPPPAGAAGSGARVRRRDERAPARKLPEYTIDARDRVVRVDRDEPARREPRKRREPERRRVEVLDLPDDSVARRGAPSTTTGPAVRQVDMLERPPAGPRSATRVAARAPTSTEPPSEADALVALHVEQGYSVPELARRLGRSVVEVRETLLATGRGWVRSWRGRQPPGEAMPPRERLVEQLDAGLGVAALAEAHDVSLAQARAWLDAYDLSLDTGARIERYRKIDGQDAALMRLPEGVQVTVDAERALELAAHAWEIAADGRPVTPLADFELPLSWVVLGIEPGESVEVTHRNGDPLDCRRANLVRVDAGEAT